MDVNYTPETDPRDGKALRLVEITSKAQMEFERGIGMRVSSFSLNEDKSAFIAYYLPSVKAAVGVSFDLELNVLFEKYKEEIEEILEG